MDDLLKPIKDQIRKLWTRADQMPVIRWGTVTVSSPLRVMLDGDPDHLPFSPQTVVKSIPVGARVVCVEQHRRVIVIAVAET